MKHDCRELLEYKRPSSGSTTDYTDCLERKAAIFVDSAVGAGLTLEDFFAAMDDLCEVAERAKKLAARQTKL